MKDMRGSNIKFTFAPDRLMGIANLSLSGPIWLRAFVLIAMRAEWLG